MKTSLLTLPVLLLLYACGMGSSVSPCMDSGGYEGKEGKCVCDVYRENGFCRIRLPNVFINQINTSKFIRIQYEGSMAGVRIGDKVLDGQRILITEINSDINLDNVVVFNDTTAYHIIAKKLGIAISMRLFKILCQRRHLDVQYFI